MPIITDFAICGDLYFVYNDYFDTYPAPFLV